VVADRAISSIQKEITGEKIHLQESFYIPLWKYFLILLGSQCDCSGFSALAPDVLYKLWMGNFTLEYELHGDYLSLAPGEWRVSREVCISKTSKRMLCEGLLN